MRPSPANASRTPGAGLGVLALIALPTVLLVLATACGGGGGESSADSALRQGKAVFDRICATCHGKDAKGLPRLGKDLHDNEFTKSLGDQELVDFLKTGRSASHPLNETGVDMPPKGGDPSITDEDLAGVVAFLRTL